MGQNAFGELNINIAKTVFSFGEASSSLVCGFHRPTIMSSLIRKAQGANAIRSHLLKVLRFPRTLSDSDSPWVLFLVDLQCIFSYFSLLFFLFLLLILYFRVKSASLTPLWACLSMVRRARGRVRGVLCRKSLSVKASYHKTKIRDHTLEAWHVGRGGPCGGFANYALSKAQCRARHGMRAKTVN